MKKKIWFLLAVALAACVVLAAGCAGDPSLDNKTYVVTFDTKVDGFVIEQMRVREGYCIVTSEIDLNNLTNPNSENAIFRGWFSLDGTERNVDKMRVTENVTLTARWSYPSETPNEIDVGSDALSQTITWIQSGFEDATNIKVVLKKASIKQTTVVDPSTGETTVVEIPSYPQTGVEVEGTVVADGYFISFVLAERPAGGLYKVEITSVFDDVEHVGIASGLRFKGTGTKDDPYLVYSEEDLLYVTTRSMEEGTVVELRNNVTLRSVYADKRGCVFNGTFIGNDKNITLKNNSALFYELGENAEVYGVNFYGAISGSDPSIGVVANYNSGYIHNVKSIAVSVNAQGGTVNDISTLAKGGGGGIVGTNKAQGRITLCTVTSGQANIIVGKIAIGGIAGVNYGAIYEFNSTATPCSATVGAYNGVEVSNTVAQSFSGCAVGVNYGTVSKVNVDGKINCRRADLTTVPVVTGATNVGGVVGYNAKSGLIDQCLFQGMRCVGDTNVGGIVGYNDGIVTNCFTGRRVRRPSNTTIEDRMFVSPVIGNNCVGGIVGKCGENSVVQNVFSTANVFSYAASGYSVAEKADNAIGVTTNQNPRLATNYLGQKYGMPYSNDLVAAIGINSLTLDNSVRVNSVVNNLLGTNYVDGKNVSDSALKVQYLTLLGDKFGYNETYGISLLWQSVNTKTLDEILNG